MPYYHIYAEWKDEIGYRLAMNENFSEEQVKKIGERIERGLKFILKNVTVSPHGIKKLEIWKTANIAVMSKKWNWIRATGQIVTNDFVTSIPVHEKRGNRKVSDPSSKETKKERSKDIFIVHGRDHEPMKELKTMLLEFGLNPIVLHEQANRGRTLIEKLEKESQHTEYAFIILTPDDVGGHREDMRKKLGIDRPRLRRHIAILEHEIDDILDSFEPRARQNVILEMGFFWGLLKRENVCFLVKEKVEEPSDIRGIGYISFKDSVNEVRGKIIKELKAAGYEIKN